MEEAGERRDTGEFACDESGYEGEKLVGTMTDVFAHATVDLTHEAAAECIREARERIRSPAMEYKADLILRHKHRSVLRWFLSPSGPIDGIAQAYLVDKPFLLVSKLVDLLAGGVEHAATIGWCADSAHRAQTRALWGDGQRAGPEPWAALLAAANELMWGRNRDDAVASVDAFMGTVDRLPASTGCIWSPDSVNLLTGGRVAAHDFRTWLAGHPDAIPPLDPLFPALLRAVAYGRSRSVRVMIAHDRQNTLSNGRLAKLSSLSDGRAELRFVDSFGDPRVQVADFLAGAARKISSDHLHDRGDPELADLLRPYVDPYSIWRHDMQQRRAG